MKRIEVELGDLLIDIELIPRVALDFKVSDIIVPCELGDILIPYEIGNIEIDTEVYLIVEVELSSEIHIYQEFDLTVGELMFMEELVGDKAARRRDRIARYFFSMKLSVQDISSQLGIHQATVYRDLNDYKKDVLKAIKKDLRSNKKILGHMVELMVQVDTQIRTIWDNYTKLDATANTLLTMLREAQRQRQENPNAPTTTPLADLIEASREVRAIHGTQQTYLALMSQKTMDMLKIWEKFGLCGEEAINLIMSGGIDIDVKVQEIRQTIIKLVDIIREEVVDQRQQRNVFGRLAREIKIGYLEQHQH